MRLADAATPWPLDSEIVYVDHRAVVAAGARRSDLDALPQARATRSEDIYTAGNRSNGGPGSYRSAATALSP